MTHGETLVAHARRLADAPDAGDWAPIVLDLADMIERIRLAGNRLADMIDHAISDHDSVLQPSEDGEPYPLATWARITQQASR